jgi:uncharacterized coiled-coil protein SlyX
MILVPVAIALFCLSLADAWHRKWKNALLYFQASVIAFLVYALWAQSHFTDEQKTKIDKLTRKLKESESQWKGTQEAENRTRRSTE